MEGSKDGRWYVDEEGENGLRSEAKKCENGKIALRLDVVEINGKRL